MLFSFLAMAFTFVSIARSDESHLESLRKQFPYGLLGDDHGLLNVKDLARNATIGDEEPFSAKSNAYPYWQCLPVKDIALRCENTGYDEDEKSTLAILAVVAIGKERDQEYLSRRAFSLSRCRAFQSDWKRLSAGESYACFSGPFSSYGTNDFGKQTTYWAFDKFKTQKGCSSYFADECNLRQGK